MKEQLKKLREAANLTQQEAAVLIGVGQSTISMWETGGSIPQTKMLTKIAEVYGCYISQIFDFNETEA